MALGMIGFHKASIAPNVANTRRFSPMHAFVTGVN
jgi:hypothetical protein